MDTVGQHFELFDPTSNIRVHLIEYGATVTNIWCCDGEGAVADILLGCPTPDDHLKPHPHFNCIVGRYANRITNARFKLDGFVYKLDANIPPHQLHGGARGFANLLWRGRQNRNQVHFEIISPDGDAGFPGELTTSAIYTLAGNTLRLELVARTTKPTPVSLTAHHYFNLSGVHGSNIHDHQLQIFADHFLPVTENLTQLGEIQTVNGTPFDLTQLVRLGDRLGADHPQNQLAEGFDHTFVINGDSFRDAAYVVDPKSNRTLKVRTDQPGVQLYTCNTLNARGKDDVRYSKHQGLCLETQQFPDAPNHHNYPNSILRPGDEFRAVTEYEFGVVER
ncbi:MAG: galactose mutarotase [Gammaproteobacteria bacterium]|nr:galactose mutarotase [Gammaproteobacteria bacterium]